MTFVESQKRKKSHRATDLLLNNNQWVRTVKESEQHQPVDNVYLYKNLSSSSPELTIHNPTIQSTTKRPKANSTSSNTNNQKVIVHIPNPVQSKVLASTDSSPAFKSTTQSKQNLPDEVSENSQYLVNQNRWTEAYHVEEIDDESLHHTTSNHQRSLLDIHEEREHIQTPSKLLNLISQFDRVKTQRYSTDTLATMKSADTSYLRGL